MTSDAVAALNEAVLCQLRLDHIDCAQRQLGKMRELAVGDWERLMVSLAEGRVAFFKGDLRCAQDHFERYLGHELPLAKHWRIAAAAYLAEIARREGRLRKRHLNRVFDYLNAYGFDWPLALEAEPLEELFRECIHREWFADRFLPALASDRTIQEAPKLSLEVVTLGGFRATLAGTEVDIAPRAQELLAYLLLYAPCRADEVADAVWPQLSHYAARNNLKVQVRHLRAALEGAAGHNGDKLIRWDRAQDSYQLSDLVTIHLDVDELENWQRCDGGAQREILRGYRGEFLPNFESDWVVTARSRYRRLAVALCLSLAAKNEYPKTAVKYYLRALEIEPLAEKAYQALQSLYQAEGDLAGMHVLEDPF